MHEAKYKRKRKDEWYGVAVVDVVLPEEIADEAECVETQFALFLTQLLLHHLFQRRQQVSCQIMTLPETVENLIQCCHRALNGDVQGDVVLIVHDDLKSTIKVRCWLRQ